MLIYDDRTGWLKNEAMECWECEKVNSEWYVECVLMVSWVRSEREDYYVLKYRVPKNFQI